MGRVKWVGALVALVVGMGSARAEDARRFNELLGKSILSSGKNLQKYLELQRPRMAAFERDTLKEISKETQASVRAQFRAKKEAERLPFVLELLEDKRFPMRKIGQVLLYEMLLEETGLLVGELAAKADRILNEPPLDKEQGKFIYDQVLRMLSSKLRTELAKVQRTASVNTRREIDFVLSDVDRGESSIHARERFAFDEYVGPQVDDGYFSHTRRNAPPKMPSDEVAHL